MATTNPVLQKLTTANETTWIRLGTTKEFYYLSQFESLQHQNIISITWSFLVFIFVDQLFGIKMHS